MNIELLSDAGYQSISLKYISLETEYDERKLYKGKLFRY